MTERNDLTPEQYAYYLGVHHGRTAEEWRWSDDEIRQRARREFPEPLQCPKCGEPATARVGERPGRDVAELWCSNAHYWFVPLLPIEVRRMPSAASAVPNGPAAATQETR